VLWLECGSAFSFLDLYIQFIKLNPFTTPTFAELYFIWFHGVGEVWRVWGGLDNNISDAELALAFWLFEAKEVNVAASVSNRELIMRECATRCRAIAGECGGRMSRLHIPYLQRSVVRR
jgi:hypothetical protein